MIANEINGVQIAECPDCGNSMITEKFDANMQPLFYCTKCGNFTNDDPKEVDNTECPECHAYERREIGIDILIGGRGLQYLYACGECGHVWTITEKQEE
ncbi:hypothetical protein MUP56_02500 [Patescibacteria group bacterium]|nr:hypothetical protein [Patescibacteria group bacterium]